MRDRRLILVCYDVATASEGGPRRLARAARACVEFGVRVQDSVYECHLDTALLNRLRRKLLAIIEPETDSLRFYFLAGTRASCCEFHGPDLGRDFEEPLVF